MTIIFETERLRVVPYTLEDRTVFYRLNSDPEITRYIRKPKTEEQSDDFLQENIELYRQHHMMGRWAMIQKDIGVHVGSFAIIPVNDTPEVQLGYALFSEYWGKGFATEAVKGGLQYAFEVMKLEKVWGITENDNIVSQKVLLKHGFREESNFMDNTGKKILRFLKMKYCN